MKESTRSGDDVKATLHTEALELADELDAMKLFGASGMIRRLEIGRAHV